ncbi:MAG: hypothetical protein ACJASQ_002506 [Crocinitomicaceae bacterium]|jgi:hypothetical protein
MDDRAFISLKEYLLKIPAVSAVFAQGVYDDGNWWVKLRLDIDHKYAWQAVQELGCVVNYISIDERLPSSFYPVSPAPYMNGGPDDYLSWIIESKDPELKPGTLMNWLEGRLPQPVDDLDAWGLEE